MLTYSPTGHHRYRNLSDNQCMFWEVIRVPKCNSGFIIQQPKTELVASYQHIASLKSPAIVTVLVSLALALRISNPASS